MQARRATPASVLIVLVIAAGSFLLGSNFAAYPGGFNSMNNNNAGPCSSTSTLSRQQQRNCAALGQRQQQQKDNAIKPAAPILPHSRLSGENIPQIPEVDPGGGSSISSAASNNNEDSPAVGKFKPPSASTVKQCVDRTMAAAESYVKFADQAATIRKERGPLRIAGFSRLWVPPLHGTGGLQFHAMHLYSQLAIKGHTVHVFVTGPSHGGRELGYSVDPNTHSAAITQDRRRAQLFVHQVPSSEDGEYSVVWYDNCLTKLREVNQSLVASGFQNGFDVIHSESWAAVANIYQIGLPAAVTWHGSMLDWFRNEINLIVHNFRMRGKMTGEHTAQRMKDLGNSVAYEAYALLAVPDHIVISDAAAYDLRHVNLLDHDSVHIIYNGVNTKNFRPAADRSATRKAFLQRVAKFDAATAEGHESLFLVGCGGRLDGIKGHHQLSVAIKPVLQKHKNIVLLVAGKGQESRRYEALQHEGLRVHMLGMMRQEDLAEFYQSVDVFVDPFYQHHGLNTVQLEASLSGVPIVVTDLASAQTTVPCNGGYGLTFALGETGALGSRIEWLVDHPAERQAMGAAGRRRAQMLFSSSVMAARYEHLLYEAAANPKPIPPIVGKVVCRHAYPKMCFRTPHLEDELPDAKANSKKAKKAKA